MYSRKGCPLLTASAHPPAYLSQVFSTCVNPPDNPNPTKTDPLTVSVTVSALSLTLTRLYGGVFAEKLAVGMSSRNVLIYEVSHLSYPP